MKARYQVLHRPDGYKCNLGYVVFDSQSGKALHRGPRWACELRTWKLNERIALGHDGLNNNYGDSL